VLTYIAKTKQFDSMFNPKDLLEKIEVKKKKGEEGAK
jgi:hypothetical protein